MLSINEATISFNEIKTALNGYFAAATMLSLNEHGSINKDKTLINPWKPLFKTYTASPKNCQYGTLKDELKRDKIIVGFLDDALSDHLQVKSDLTLTDAACISRQAEMRKKN